jgi:hypothetical protein
MQSAPAPLPALRPHAPPQPGPGQQLAPPPQPQPWHGQRGGAHVARTPTGGASAQWMAQLMQDLEEGDEGEGGLGLGS